jgi:hypothetical protein
MDQIHQRTAVAMWYGGYNYPAFTLSDLPAESVISGDDLFLLEPQALRGTAVLLPLTLAFLGLLSPLTQTSAVQSMALPEGLAKRFRAREGRWNGQTLQWKIDQVIYYPSPGKAAIAAQEKVFTDEARQKAQRRGITDPKEVEAFVRKTTGPAVKSLQPSRSAFAGQWEFASRAGEIDVVGDVMEKVLGYTVTGIQKKAIRSFYRSGYAGEYARSTIAMPELNHSSTKILIWATPERSWDHFNPSTEGLRLLPEDFVVLTGKNPLGMHGAKWNLVKTTPGHWTVETTVTKGSYAPYVVRQELDREHDGVPSSIHMVSEAQRWSASYSVKKFIKIKGDWMPEQCSFVWESPSIVIRKREWTLLRVSGTGSITGATGSAVPLPIDGYVMDTRLLGPHLTGNEITDAIRSGNPKLVQYSFTGGLPSEAELRAKIISGQNEVSR